MAEQELSPAELLAAYNQRFTDPVPPEAGPFQQIIPEEETYRDMAERTLAGMLGDDREAYRRAGTLLRTADEIPVLGDVTAATDVLQALKDRDIAGLGIAGLGFIPGMAGMARRGGDGGDDFLEELRRRRDELRQKELAVARNRERAAQEKMAEDYQAGLRKGEVRAYNRDLDIAEQALREAEAKERALTVQIRDELPDHIITRDAEGNPLSDEEFRKANVMGFHGTRNATERIYEQGSVASMREGDIVSVEDAAFFHGDAPLPAKTFGQTIIPSRIDTREFVTVDMGGNSYMEDPLKGTSIVIDSPVEIEVLGQKAKKHKIPAGLLTYEENTGEFTDRLITDLKKQGIPGVVLKDYTDIDPAGAVLHFPTPEQRELRDKFFDPSNKRTQEVIVVLDKTKQRLAKGNPRTLYDPDTLSHTRAMDPESGFNQGGQVQKFANGGMVNSMNRFPQTGPLARQPFSRETMAPPSMDFFLPSINTQITVPTFAQMGGGINTGIPDFTGRVYTQDEEEVVTPTATATTQETTMPAGLNPLQQKLVASGDLQLEDLGYTKDTVKGTDPTVTSVFQTTTPAEDLIETTTETTTEPVTETTTEPVIETTTEPVIETTTEPVIETTTEPVIETTTEPLTPFETTTETTTEPVIETTTEPVIETTTEPVVDTAPLVVTEPLASEELATTTEGEPVSLVPSPTEEDVPMFTVQDQPDAPDEQPFVPITGVSPDLSVNQYLDTTYQTGYPTTQGMEIKESLIPGQEYSAERLAAGEMIDVIKPDLGSGAELPSVDFSNIGFGTEEEIETELYEKPEFISTDPTTGQDPDFASGPTPQDFLADSRTGEPINWKTVGEGTMDFLTNPLRGLEGLASNVADRIWSNRPEFFLSTHVKNPDGTLKLDTNGKPIRRNGMGTLINRVLDKIYEERPNILFKEYINEGEEREGEVYGTLRDKTKPTEEVSDKTEAGQQTFLDRLWSGLGEGLNMMNPFKYLQGGDQQFVGEQPMFPTTTPVTLTDVTFDEEGNPVFTNKRFLGEIQGTNLSAAQRRQFYDFYTNLSDYDRAVADRARSPEYKALYDSMNFDAEGNATAETPYDAQLQLLNFVDPEGTSTIPSVVTARDEEKRIATMKINMIENGYTEEEVYELGQKALQGDVAAMQDLMALQGRSQDFIDTYIRSFERAQQGGRAREAYEMASGGANRWGTARMGSIQERASGFSPASYHVGSGGQGVQYSAVPNEPDAATRGGWRGTQSIVAGTGRLPAAGGSWGGLNPFFEVPQPGDPMYADYLMDTMGPGKNFENEIQAMVERDLPFVQVTDGQGNGYLINKETGDIMYGPFPVDSTNTGGGGTGPGGGMAEGGPVVRNVGEAEGIAGLFENMMGPGRVDETERVYEYPGGTMTERVSRGSFNLRTG